MTKTARLLLGTLAVLSLSLSRPAVAEIIFDDSIQDGPPGYNIDVTHIPDAVPKALPFSTTGNPPFYDVNGKRYYVLKTNKNYRAEGQASWYGTKFHGKRTSSGDTYNMFAMTAASPVLPIPSYVQVTNLKNGRQVVVKVNDRGPFHEGRIMDLSYAAAKKLGMLGHGTTHVRVEAINTGAPITLAAANNQSNLYLQVGTFSQSVNASLIAQKIGARLQQRVRITPISQSNQVLYRVLIGPLASLEQSEALRARLIAQGLTGSIPVRL